jgi:gluconolactonase
MKFIAITCLACLLAASASAADAPIGHVTRFDPAMDGIVAPDAKIEKLAEGFTWSEGPVWIAAGKYLLFTDVPANTLYQWSESEGLKTFLKPSGYAGPDFGILREAGANGLFPDRTGVVLLANSGSRIIERLDLATRQKSPLATSFGGKHFNSPNDVIRRRDGTVFFTDPPYGLKGINDSPAKELAFNGVYRVDLDGKVSLIDDQLAFPNGVALSPDERTLYVSNSDPKRPIWMAYTLSKKGEVVSKRVFADASDLMGENAPGLPDGMKVAPDGHLFASAPGGILVMTPDGRRLGRIETGTAISNCAIGNDGQALYMTSNHILARIRLVPARL